jgi:hypothetical protein
MAHNPPLDLVRHPLLEDDSILSTFIVRIAGERVRRLREDDLPVRFQIEATLGSWCPDMQAAFVTYTVEEDDYGPRTQKAYSVSVCAALLNAFVGVDALLAHAESRRDPDPFFGHLPAFRSMPRKPERPLREDPGMLTEFHVRIAGQRVRRTIEGEVQARFTIEGDIEDRCPQIGTPQVRWTLDLGGIVTLARRWHNTTFCGALEEVIGAVDANLA